MREHGGSVFPQNVEGHGDKAGTENDRVGDDCTIVGRFIRTDPLLQYAIRAPKPNSRIRLFEKKLRGNEHVPPWHVPRFITAEQIPRFRENDSR